MTMTKNRSAMTRDLLRAFAKERGLPLDPMFLTGQDEWSEQDRDDYQAALVDMHRRLDEEDRRQ